MASKSLTQIYSKDILAELFPESRSDQFFKALLGCPTEAPCDINLEFKECNQNELRFEFCLRRRMGKCMASSLTSDLPLVFALHPVINVEGIVKDLDRLLNGHPRCTGWTLGDTRRVAPDIDVIPLVVSLHAQP